MLRDPARHHPRRHDRSGGRAVRSIARARPIADPALGRTGGRGRTVAGARREAAAVQHRRSSTSTACCTSRSSDDDHQGRPLSTKLRRGRWSSRRRTGRCDACPVLCQISAGQAGACDRYGNRTASDAGHAARRQGVARRLRSCRSGRRPGTGASPRAGVRLRHRLGHHLSRLQAGALHRRLAARRRRHGHRRHRGHLQLLQLQGEDRHRPLPRPRAGDGAPPGRGGRPRHHDRVRLAVPGARRRAPPHRRLQEGRPRRLRDDDGARQQAAGRARRSKAARRVVVAADRAPVVDGVEEQRMRVGCGSATIGIFAQQWFGHVDEVVVVDDHITGVLSEHQAGQVPRHGADRHPRARPEVDAGALLPGRQSRARAGAAPTSPIRSRSSSVGREARRAAGPAPADGLDHRRGLRAWFVLDDALAPLPAEMPAGGAACRRADRRELRAFALLGALHRRRRRQPARRRHREPGRADALDQVALVNVTCGGAPVYVWPGGGITVMVDVAQMPDNQLRLGADAGDRLADRVHDAARRLPRARRPHGSRAPARRACSRERAGASSAGDAGKPWPLCAPGERAALTCRGAASGPRIASTAAAGTSSTGRSTCIVEASASRRVGARDRARLDALRRPCSTSWSPSCRCCAAARRAPSRRARAARSRGAWSPPCRPHRARLHHGDGRGRRQRRRGAAERRSPTAHRPRLGQQRRRHRPAPAAGRAPSRRRLSPTSARSAGRPLDGRSTIDAAMPVRGIATSGWRGRSFSLGIADSVTVLAPTASAADAAATIIANAVDVDDARDRRAAGERAARRQRPRRSPRHRARSARSRRRRSRPRSRQAAQLALLEGARPSRLLNRRKDSHALSRDRRRPRRREEARLRRRGRLARQRPAFGAAAAAAASPRC